LIEGYVNSAFQIGLRPEFALLCGIHPDNKYISDGEKERWYIQTPAQHVEDLVRMYASMLGQMWEARAKDKSFEGDLKKGTDLEKVDT